MRARGASGPAYETIVASGPNAALPHARPTDRALTDGDTVIIDAGAVVTTGLLNMRRFEQRPGETLVLGELLDKRVDLIETGRRRRVRPMRRHCLPKNLLDQTGPILLEVLHHRQALDLGNAR